MISRFIARGMLATLTAACLILTANVAAASPVTFSFTGGTDNNNPFGNTLGPFGVGVTVSASAWSYNGSFATAELDQWSGLGLAVCNQSEGLNCSSPSHQVDNKNGTDFVLFHFSAPVNPTEVDIVQYSCGSSGCTQSLDVSYWLGTITAAQLNGATIGAGPGFLLSAGGLGSMTENDGTASPRAVPIVGGSLGVTNLLFGAQYPGDGTYDYFKISTLKVDTQHRQRPQRRRRVRRCPSRRRWCSSVAACSRPPRAPGSAGGNRSKCEDLRM